VRSGFYVMAQGDIQVGELVEAALLSADGDIVVNQGVKGGGKAVLRSKGTVGVTFAEQSTILAVGNVQAKNSLVHCEVKSNGKVRMIGDRCSIVGGRTRAREGLETFNLGSERGVRTQIEFGQNYLIADRIEAEEREMEKLKREIARIDLAMKEAERSGERTALDGLHTRKLGMLKLLEKRGLRIFTYRERFEEHHESEILVKGTLHPGVVIETHGRRLEITTPSKNVIISFSPETGRIEQRSAAKEQGASQ
ncbi:MAG: FapA family protein, partial [Spirochaetota bacterium]